MLEYELTTVSSHLQFNSGWAPVIDAPVKRQDTSQQQQRHSQSSVNRKKG